MKPSQYDLESPIAAIATALVPSALGVVRVTGKDSLLLLSSAFSRPKALIEARGNSAVHGWIVDGDGKKVDETVVVCYRAPKSFTGEESAEVMCHGGPACVIACLNAILRAGFRQAERGEFTLRAFANGKIDLTESEAVREIIDSRTDAARAAAAERLSGSLSLEIRGIRDLIVRALAAIGVEIEYPEDEETVKGAFDARPIQDAAGRLEALESAWSARRVFREGAVVVLAGKTNAGKSSLFNAILKSDRAIVSNAHGTTRDWLEAEIDCRGIPVRLFDTAGIRETDDAVEAEGVARSRALARGADAVIYLVDACAGPDAGDEEFVRSLGDGVNAILAWNKADKEGALPAPESSAKARAVVAVSAKTGLGIGDLMTSLASSLASEAQAAADGPAPGTERQRAAIAEARAFLAHALRAESEGFPLDAVASDLENALDSLALITGETTGADVLDAVFSDFCVGK
jgi:tRNA modification GTPase